MTLLNLDYATSIPDLEACKKGVSSVYTASSTGTDAACRETVQEYRPLLDEKDAQAETRRMHAFTGIDGGRRFGRALGWPDALRPGQNQRHPPSRTIRHASRSPYDRQVASAAFAWSGSNPDRTTQPPGARRGAKPVASRFSGSSRILAKITRRAPVPQSSGRRPGCRKSCRLDNFDERAYAVAPGVVPSDQHGRRINIVPSGRRAPSWSLRPQHARTRTDVEHGGPMRATAAGASRAVPVASSADSVLHFKQTVERQQAAPGGPMMSGANASDAQSQW